MPYRQKLGTPPKKHQVPASPDTTYTTENDQGPTMLSLNIVNEGPKHMTTTQTNPR